jgi:hypothetical protein
MFEITKETWYNISHACNHSTREARGSQVHSSLGYIAKPYLKIKKTTMPGISYLRDEDWEDCSLRPAQANSLQDPISKITRAKLTRE